MRLIIAMMALAVSVPSLVSAEDTAASEKTGDSVERLSPDRVEVLYLAQGRATTVQLISRQKVRRIFAGAEIVSYRYDEDLNQIQLIPQVDEGEMNINVTIGDNTYVMVLKVVRDRRLQYRRTFTVEDANVTEEITDEALLEKAKPLKPTQIDIVALSRIATRAQADPTYRQTLPTYRYDQIDKRYSWNDNIVRLVEVHQFLDMDLLLFKVEWVNRAHDAIYLNARQYGLKVANQRIPVNVAMQAAPNSIVMPGQYEVAWLAVQGYRLRRHEDWDLVLPPDGRTLSGVQ